MENVFQEDKACVWVDCVQADGAVVDGQVDPCALAGVGDWVCLRIFSRLMSKPQVPWHPYCQFANKPLLR